MDPAFVTPPDTRRPPSAGVAPIVVRHTRADDIDQHTQQLHDWNLQYDQLDCGAFEGQFTDIRWPGMQLFVEKMTRHVRQRGNLTPDSFSIGTVLEGEGAIGANGIRSGVGALITCDVNELDVCTPTNCTLAGLVIDKSVLQDAVERMPDLGSLMRFGTLLTMSPPADAFARWSSLLIASVREIVQQPQRLQDSPLRQGLHDDLLLGLINVMAAARQGELWPIRASSRKRIVDRACELMLSQPEAPPSLFEVCKRIGASPRKLSYCFQDVLGLSPARYIKVIRLNAARRELGRGDDLRLSVYDVAAQGGFWHFGHFSADYKKQFSELPSETLRRARADLSS